MNLRPDQIDTFQTKVWEYYQLHARTGLPWRQSQPDGSFDPYHILVSELMLQQTQVSRVTQKYHEFLERFPTISSLAAAPLADVLMAWSGLGYNRRAKFLHAAAKTIVVERGGVFPTDASDLASLPGIGPNTAGAIRAYAFNLPSLFIETNIRTVYFHHFYNAEVLVSDKELIRLVEQTLDSRCPREWYWALMDYGSYLKASGKQLNHLSKHYSKQTTFEGSVRQLRGKVLRTIGTTELSLAQLQHILPDIRLQKVLTDLVVEGLISRNADSYRLSQ